MSHDIINIKDCRKAVNQAKYMPTAARKAQALKLLKQLTKAVANLEEVAPKAKRVKRKTSNQRLEEAQAKDNVSTTYLKSKPTKSHQAPRKEVVTLSEGETAEMAMAKLRTKRVQDAKAVAIAEFEATL